MKNGVHAAVLILMLAAGAVSGRKLLAGVGPCFGFSFELGGQKNELGGRDAASLESDATEPTLASGVGKADQLNERQLLAEQASDDLIRDSQTGENTLGGFHRLLNYKPIRPTANERQLLAKEAPGVILHDAAASTDPTREARLYKNKDTVGLGPFPDTRIYSKGGI